MGPQNNRSGHAKSPSPSGKTLPVYRKRKGSSQAVVTLTDSATGKRRDYWLGEHGSPASREAYMRLLTEYEATGRRLPDRRLARPAFDPSGPTVSELSLEYWRKVARDHLPKRAGAIRSALRLLRAMDGSTPARGYGPLRLGLLREAMIAGDPRAAPPRRPWCRSTVNDRVRIVVSVFRWGVSQEMVPPSVPAALATLEPLRRGRSRAREGRRVSPVPGRLLEGTLGHLPAPVRAMVRLQLLTAARPGEIVALRGVDLEPDGRTGLLVVRPAQHKTAHLGAERVLYFGPEAQAVLAPFLAGRDPSAPLFSPAEAEAQRRAGMHARRRTPIGYGNRPGTNRVPSPARSAGESYTVDSYRRAIEYACDRAFPRPPRLRPGVGPDGRRETQGRFLARLSPEEREELRRWRREHRWHPHQLRHNAATRIRREFGLEAAQLVLGHSSAALTDAVYAERDAAKVAQVILRAG